MLLRLGALDVVCVDVAASLTTDGIEYRIDRDLGEEEAEEVAGVMMGGGMDSLTSIQAHQHAYHLCHHSRHLVFPDLDARKENPWH